MSKLWEVPVRLGDRSYRVHVGQDWLARLDEVVDLGEPGRKALVVTQQPVVDAGHVARVEQAAGSAGLDVTRMVIGDGERAKSVATLARLWEAAATTALVRDDLIIAVGGGVVGDLAGFAAATYNRGVAVLQVPTTLLAQVDAAIGGKTGINLEQGKNLVGAFHQPLGVAIDVSTLATLSSRTLVEGLGEIVKCGLIADGSILDALEADPQAVVSGDVETQVDLVVRAARVKAEIVAADEREGGRRAWLNFGHTWAHVIEASTGYATFLHGEAVAVGMVVALHLGRRLGHTPPALVQRAERLLETLGLPTRAPAIEAATAGALLGRDKKVTRGRVRFVVLDRVGSPVVVTPAPEEVWATLRELEAVR